VVRGARIAIKDLLGKVKMVVKEAEERAIKQKTDTKLTYAQALSNRRSS
jgi:hypothetical protein